MRAVIQKVKKSAVYIDGKCHASIGHGLNILLGIEDSDTEEDIDWLCKKIINLRIFEDENDVMNLSVSDIHGEILVISQFTLFASTKKGNRPSYIRASKGDFAEPMYNKFISKLELYFGNYIKSGIFGGSMDIEIINEGPTTILIDTHNKE